MNQEEKKGFAKAAKGTLESIWENWPMNPEHTERPLLNLTSYEIEDCKRIMLNFARDFYLHEEFIGGSTEKQEVQKAIERLFTALNIHGAN